MTARLFISHSEEDSEQARDLADWLESEGIPIWIESGELAAGDLYSNEIGPNILECAALIFVLSEASMDRTKFAFKELSFAVENHKTIIPLKVNANVKVSTGVGVLLAGTHHRVVISDRPNILRAIKKLPLLVHTDLNEKGITREKFTVCEERKSLVIMPFENRSNGKKHGWFAEGFRSELIDSLAMVTSLYVHEQQTSSSAADATLQKVGIHRSQGNDYFLEGSAYRSEDHFEISLTLQDSHTGEVVHLFEGTSVFKNAIEVTSRTIQDLLWHLKLTNDEKIMDRGTDDPRAFESNIKGKQSSDLETEEGFRSALRYHRKAYSIDPTFAEAHMLAANAMTELYRVFDKRRFYLDEAETHLRIAEGLKPSLHRVKAIRSEILFQKGDKLAAENAAKDFAEEDPSAYSFYRLGFYYWEAERSDDAIGPFEESINRKPQNLKAHWHLVLAYDTILAKEECVRAAKRALPHYEERIRLFPSDVYAQVVHANLLYHAGEKADALRKLVEIGPVKDGRSCYNLACLLLKFDIFDLAEYQLRKALSGHFADVWHIERDPDLSLLKEHDRARFDRLMQEFRNRQSTPQHYS